MKNPHAAFEDAVEDFEQIADEWHDVNARALGNPLRGFRMLGDPHDHLPNARFECRGNGFTIREAFGRSFVQVGDRAFGILNLHARRNARNAAWTSRSVAVALRSASSMARSSSSVA